MESVNATAKFIKGSPRKARLVARAVVGKPAMFALGSLEYMSKRAADPIYKAIKSAVANAVHNYQLDADRLVVTKVTIDAAPMLKRGRIASKGRYRMILKRNNHITVEVGYPVTNTPDSKNQVQKPETKEAEVVAVEEKQEAKKPAAKKSTATKKVTKSKTEK